MKNLLFVALAFTVVGCSSNSDHSATSQNLCEVNLNKISNYSAQYASTTGEPENSQLKMLHEKAKYYKQMGDVKNCIATSEQALSIIAQHTNK